MGNENRELAETLLLSGQLYSESYGSESLSSDESLRREVCRWLDQTRWEYFFTLTFRTIHSKQCASIKADGGEECGERLYSERGCKVPGVRTINKSVGWFQTVVPGSFIVLETGKLGRRHLHGLAYSKGALRLTTSSDGLHASQGDDAVADAIEKHAKSYGRVDIQNVNNQAKAIEYVAKYVTKEMFEDGQSDNDAVGRWFPDTDQLRWRERISYDNPPHPSHTDGEPR